MKSEVARIEVCIRVKNGNNEVRCICDHGDDPMYMVQMFKAILVAVIESMRENGVWENDINMLLHGLIDEGIPDNIKVWKI